MSEPSAAAPPAVSTSRLVVQAVLQTDVGRVRTENQDFATLTTAREEAASRAGGRLMIIADGMGGHRGGGTASRLAVETVKATYLGAESDEIPARLQEGV